MVVTMDTPKPPTGALTGRDGTMLRKGSAGRLALPTQADYDPSDSRCNESGLDDLASGGETAY